MILLLRFIKAFVIFFIRNLPKEGGDLIFFLKPLICLSVNKAAEILSCSKLFFIGIRVIIPKSGLISPFPK